ncbi:MAG: cation:proton antiporter domain-containing protein [Terriglobales bacterium]
MDVTHIFGLLAGLLIVAFVANRLFRITRVPDLVILLTLGLLLGPIFKIIDPDRFTTFTNVLGNLALVLILFEGGLELRLKDTLRHFPGGVLLAFLGYGLSFGLVAASVHWGMRMSWHSSFLLGAVFGCTSSTVILPVLQQMHVREPVKLTLLLESAIGDIIGVLTVSSLIDITPDQPVAKLFLSGLAVRVIVAVLLAVAAGVLWSRLWRYLSTQRFSNALSFGVVLGIYASTQAAGGSGLLAVLAFGLTLGNVPGQPIEAEPGMLEFHSELSFLVRSFFFVLLGAEVQFVALRYVWPMLGIIGTLLVARAVAIWTSRIALHGMTVAERETIFFMLPRGLITAVLAVEVTNARGNEFEFLPAMALTVMLVTNLMLVVGSLRAARQAASLEKVTAT